MVGDGQEGVERREPDQLGLRELHAVLGGDLADRLPHHPQGRDFEVEDVHRDLGPAELLDPEAVGLDRRRARRPIRGRVARSRLARSTSVGREVDVVGDEERAGADGDGAGRGVHPGRAEVRLTAVLVDLGLQALVLPAADVGELDPVRPVRRVRVEEHRQIEPRRRACCPNARARATQSSIVVVTERHERDDVHRPDPRVLPGVRVHVDLVDRRGHEPLERLADGVVLAGEREDGPVVARVARPVEQVDARDGRDRVGETVDDVEPTTLGDVRDGFDEHPSMLRRPPVP